MLIPRRRRKALLILVALVTAALSIPSTAHDIASRAMKQVRGTIGAISSDDPCIVYTYDANGNRQTQMITVSGGGMTPTWGTGTWGCFKWTP
jgi:hypothetical protein